MKRVKIDFVRMIGVYVLTQNVLFFLFGLVFNGLYILQTALNIILLAELMQQQ